MHGDAKENVWVGIDLGTQSVRAIALSATGEVLGHGSHPLSSWRDGCRHEQNPEQWWLALGCACRVALADIPRDRIRGVAVDGTSGTILLVNRFGCPLTPALMYDDTRADVETARANEAGADLWNSLGYRAMQRSWALPKLLWLVRVHSCVVGHARLVHQADFINWRLAGQQVASDSSNALKTGYDLLRERWPAEVFDELGIPDHLLPEVVRPGTPIGVVFKDAAEITGLPAGTPIFAGMTDGCAAQIAAGALEPGNWNSVLGTTLVLKGVSRELIRDPQGVVYSHRSPDGNWLPGGASSTGAGILAKNFGARDLNALTATAGQREPSSAIAYPLISRGERFPFIAPEAEGFVLGTPADEIDYFAAVLQGVGFIERLCFDYLDLLGAPVDRSVSFTGGATRNRYWCQLRADILGRTVFLPVNAEPAFGMAVLAAGAECGISDAAKQMVTVAEVIEPRPRKFDRFAESYLHLLHEFEARGWIDRALLAHATVRAGECSPAEPQVAASPMSSAGVP